VLWLLASSGLVHAQVVFNADSTNVSLNGNMQFLPDDDNRLSLADAIRAQREGRMKNLLGRFNRGYAPVASWLSVIVKNDGLQPVSPTLVMTPPYLDEVDVYVLSGSDPSQPEDYMRFSVGDHTPLALQPLPTALMTVPLSISPGSSQTIFIRIHSFSAHNLNANLVSPQEFITKISQQLTWHAAFCAVALALGIINFLLAIRLRDRVFALYGSYLIMLFCAIFGVEGIIRIILPHASHQLADWFVGAGIGLGFTSMVLFVICIFNTASHHRWAHRYLQVTAVLGTLVFFSSGTSWYPPLVQILQTNGLLLSFLLPWLAWRSIKRGQVATGRLFLMAFGASNVGAVITILGVINIIPLGEFTLHALQITSIIHMIVMMLALSERVLAAEAELRKASSQAEGRAVTLASHMNEALISKKQELERSLDSERRMRDEQGQFIDTISHEYRTPLSIVRTNLDILQVKQQIDDKRFGVMATALNRLEDIFKDALKAHRLGRPPPPEVGVIDLKSLLDLALGDIRHSAPDCPFDCHTESGLFSMSGDAGLLTTVLRNVLGNAAKYRSRGIVSITLSREGERAVLVVDNAIDSNVPLDSERLFDRWARGQSAPGSGGMGLGLYLVRRILHDHGGDVAITTPTAGRFVITLTLPLICPDANG